MGHYAMSEHNALTVHEPHISLSGVSFGYSPGVAVIRDIELTVLPGEIVTLVGASGCGKSTLLKVAAGLLVPDEGTVRCASHPGDPAPPPGPDRLLVLQEQEQLFPWLSARDNIAFALRWARERRYTRAQRREIAVAALSEVELPPDAVNRYPHQLSGGMRQRVALARAFALRPAVLLLDEPFAAVDEPTRRRLGDILLRIQTHAAGAVLFVTHDIDEALRLGDRLVVMDRSGRIAITETRRQAERDRARIVALLDR
jgi:NitT/TauT family transport system ATP-binding protein